MVDASVDALPALLPDEALGLVVVPAPLAEVLPAVSDDALGLVVDPAAPADVSPAAEPLRLPLVFADALPDDALCEWVLGLEAARSPAPEVDVPLD